MTARDFTERAPPREHRDPEPHLHGALDAVEAGKRDLDVDRRMTPFVYPQYAFAGRRRIVVGDDRLASDFLDRDALLRRETMVRIRQHHELVATE